MYTQDLRPGMVVKWFRCPPARSTMRDILIVEVIKVLNKRVAVKAKDPRTGREWITYVMAESLEPIAS